MEREPKTRLSALCAAALAAVLALASTSLPSRAEGAPALWLQGTYSLASGPWEAALYVETRARFGAPLERGWFLGPVARWGLGGDWSLVGGLKGIVVQGDQTTAGGRLELGVAWARALRGGGFSLRVRAEWLRFEGGVERSRTRLRARWRWNRNAGGHLFHDLEVFLAEQEPSPSERRWRPLGLRMEWDGGSTDLFLLARMRRDPWRVDPVIGLAWRW